MHTGPAIERYCQRNWLSLQKKHTMLGDMPRILSYVMMAGPWRGVPSANMPLEDLQKVLAFKFIPGLHLLEYVHRKSPGAMALAGAIHGDTKGREKIGEDIKETNKPENLNSLPPTLCIQAQMPDQSLTVLHNLAQITGVSLKKYVAGKTRKSDLLMPAENQDPIGIDRYPHITSFLAENRAHVPLPLFLFGLDNVPSVFRDPQRVAVGKAAAFIKEGYKVLEKKKTDK